MTTDLIHTTLVTKAAHYRAGAKGWIVRHYLAGYGAWEPEENLLRTVYRTRREAEDVVARELGAEAARSSFGRLGGSSGRGEAKRRTPEHYAAISRKGVKARRAKK